MRKKEKIRIGIVGCGAIGTSLAREISSSLKKDSQLVALYDINSCKSFDLARKISLKGKVIVSSLDTLIKKSDLVIEASSSKSSWDIANKTLQAGRDIMIMSVGGVAGKALKLKQLAKRKNATVYIPSGAICGIDALKAVYACGKADVVLTTRKHPVSFKGVPFVEKMKINLNAIKKDKLLFSGNASQAIKLFPQNINVAAVLAMAGSGLERTKVRIIASPKTRKNTHEIRIKSRSADIFTRTENVLHPQNPKTSYLAVLSAIAVLRKILQPVKIGT